MTFAAHIQVCAYCRPCLDWCEIGSALLREELFQNVERREAEERCEEISEE